MTLGADPLISATTVISHEKKGRPLAGLIVRKESKGHGTNQYVEGLSTSSPAIPWRWSNVVTTGGSLLKACERVEPRPERGCRMYRA